MEELRKFRSSTFDTIARRKLIEDQNTILELSSRIQELQNEVTCMNDTKDFQDAESVRSGNSPRYQSTSVIPTSSNPWREVGDLHSLRRSRREGPPCIWDTLGVSGNVFCRSTCIFISPYPQELHQWNSSIFEAAPFIHSGEKWKVRTKSRSEMPVCTVSHRFSHLQWRRLFKELWSRPTTTADFGSSLWQIPYTSDVCLLEDKVQDRGYVLARNFLRKRCNGSKKWRWLIQSMNEDIHYLYGVFQCRILKYLMWGLPQHWTKSSIILISKEESVWRNKMPRSRTVAFVTERLLTWSTITSGSLGIHDSVENYADLFTISLQNDDIQEFNSKWDGILLSMTKIPPDDILEGLYKLRIRESEKLKTVLEVYDMEIHQKILTPCVKESKITNFDCEILTPDMRKSKQVQWSWVTGD